LRPSAALRVDEGCMRGSKKDGRRSAMASEGLYIAVMMALVNDVARTSMQGARCGGGVRAACNDAGQGRGCDGPHPSMWRRRPRPLSFGWTTHSSFTPQHVHVACTRSLDAPLFLLILRHRGRGSMASNKKSGLTGYLPDILMAAAAVRSRFSRVQSTGPF
jgi:hypothetical protein